MKVRHIKQQLNCELQEMKLLEMEPPEYDTLEYSPAPSGSIAHQREKEAARLRREGLTLEEVAKRLGVSRFVAGLASRRGEPGVAVRRSPKTNARRKVIAEMRSAGHTYTEIAKVLGVCKQSVAFHAAEMRAQQQREKIQ